MSVFETHYPQIQETRLHIEARIAQLEDKLFSRKQVSDQVNHEELQYNIANLYNMMRETAENQVMLQKELSLMRGGGVGEGSVEARIHRLELSRREAEEKAMLLQRQLDSYNVRDEKERLLGYELSTNKRLLDIELDNRINLYKAGLEEDSRKLYQHKMRNIISQEEMELEELRKDREAFQRSYRNFSTKDLIGSSKKKEETHSFGGSYYGRSAGKGYEPMTDYKRHGESNLSSSYRKEDDRTQPSPDRKYEDLEKRGGNRGSDQKEGGSASKRYYYQDAHHPDTQQSNQKKRFSQDERSREHNTLDIEDLKPKYNNEPKQPNTTILQRTKNGQEDSNSDSLENTKKMRQRDKQHHSKSFSRSPQKRRSGSKHHSKTRGDPSLYSRYMNVKISEKSPSKKRKEAATAQEIETNALQKIRKRIVTAWAVYQDSTFRNTKHEKDHLFNTYNLEVRLRNEMKQKVNAHPITQKKFGFIAD